MSTNLPVLATKTHAVLGASSAHRWIPCPGSVRLTRDMPSTESEYTREGTEAHALGERWIRTGLPTNADADMLEPVGIFVEHCWLLQRQTQHWWVEEPISLEPLSPPEPMWGTPDFVAYLPETREVHVVDLKFGIGVVVEVEDNEQTRYYALGTVLRLHELGFPVDRVHMTIVQPRIAHKDGPVRTEVIDVLELAAFAQELMQAARATQAPDAALVPGEHCRFCPASAVCPALYAHAQAIAQVEFADVPMDVPPAPEELPVWMLADMLTKLPVLEAWSKSMYAHAEQLLRQGIEVPGFKLVARRATRKWARPEEAQSWLEARGYAEEEILDTSLKSPHQIEGVMGKDKKSLPADLIIKVSSGQTLVPNADPRAAVMLTAGDEFAALPAAPTGKDHTADRGGE